MNSYCRVSIACSIKEFNHGCAFTVALSNSKPPSDREVAETNKKERESKISKAENELKALLESVEEGEIDSRTERDEKIGYVKRKYWGYKKPYHER